jgi:hypothetical protein
VSAILDAEELGLFAVKYKQISMIMAILGYQRELVCIKVRLAVKV